VCVSPGFHSVNIVHSKFPLDSTKHYAVLTVSVAVIDVLCMICPRTAAIFLFHGRWGRGHLLAIMIVLTLWLER